MLHIHRAERADGLVASLGAVLEGPLEDPLAPEVVAVPTRGVERWLTQRLSARLGASPGREDGVCANVEFPFPGRLVGGAVAAATGVDRDDDPWLPERLVWPLLEVVDECLAEPWLAPLAAHLGGAGPDADPARRARRFASLRHVADLYDRYGVHRPAMLRAWAAGEDVDGSDRSLSPGDRWQPELWRRLRGRLGPGPAERLEDACAHLRAEPALSGLPQRLSLFGLTRLPASYLEVLQALAAARDVHLFLLHPSPVLWRRLAEALAGGPPPVRRAQDPTAALAANPLLASWGRDAREMQLSLSRAAGAGDDHRQVTGVPVTLLGRLQDAVRTDRSPPGPPLPGRPDARPLLDPDDRSVQVHACHGRARQVEVMRDAILHLLAEDPTLEPRDVIVMCPDIEAFAPLVHAAFGAGEADEAADVAGAPPPGTPDLRVRLADRSLRQTNPLLGVVARLLELAPGRVTASEALDLAAREPVRRRFGLDDDDLARMEEWIAATGIHWGLDGAHRAPFGLKELETHTWSAGLDRVLVGVTMAEEGQRLLGGVLPLDDVEGSAIDLAGRLAELVDRLGAAVDGLSRPQPLRAWSAAIARAADLLALVAERDAWQRAELTRLLDEVAGDAGPTGESGGPELAPAEVRALLDDRLRGRPTRANFRTGHLTVCTLVPMRSVPHRVVCLLGLDDGVFPRIPARDGDDLTLADPHVGDRDARGEDRQLLLDALMAATERLVIAYGGRDERTNAERPPAVPVGELLDVVDRSVRTGEVGADGAEVPARRRVLVRHPLQPFDPRNFTPGALVPARPWSFDASALGGARALAGERSPRPAFLPARLPPPGDEPLALDDLIAFVRHPVRAFLRQRLGVSLAEWGDELEDGLPLSLDALGLWGVGERLLAARLAGADPAACAAAERARGALPPGALSQDVLDRIGPAVDRLAADAAALTPDAGEAASLDVPVRLPGGRLLVGTVPGVHGDLLRAVSYSRVGPAHRLVAWVRLLAATAAHPERPLAAATVGRRRDGAPPWAKVTVARIPPLGADAGGRRERALAELGTLVDLHARGMREPLPIACQASAAYAQAAAGGWNGAAAALKAWRSDRDWDREDRHPEHVLVLGGVRSLDDLLAAKPAEDETGPGWDETETTRFGRCARRLWDPLLALEEVTDA